MKKDQLLLIKCLEIEERNRRLKLEIESLKKRLKQSIIYRRVK